MGWFTPYKRKANEFHYTPRYFDPEKERREQRRRELSGESASAPADEYTPGQYIRTQREARAERRASQSGRHGISSVAIVMAVALILAFVCLLLPRIAEAFISANASKAVAPQQEEFNPYTPITVVPNDYNENDNNQ